MDVIEIDAASNRGINEMRELRENVRFRPARDRYKVFIVDEAHQITNEAFNALLKTLEEPPEWVVFILCTTESHKIPSTIVSRCQQFSFRSVDFAELVERMRWIMRPGGHRSRRRGAQRARAGRRRQRPRFAFGARSGHRLLRDQAESRRGARAARRVLARIAGRSCDSADRRPIRARMLEMVAELEAQRRQPAALFARAGALFPQSAGREDLRRRDAAGGGELRTEQSKLAETAASFQRRGSDALSAAVARSVPRFAVSLQPRLHLEIGLLRMVHAGKLQSIEEACVFARAASPSARSEAPRLRRLAPAERPSPIPASGRRCAPGSTPRCSKPNRLHLADAHGTFRNRRSADESWCVTTPKMYLMYLKQPDFETAVAARLGEAGQNYDQGRRTRARLRSPFKRPTPCRGRSQRARADASGSRASRNCFPTARCAPSEI